MNWELIETIGAVMTLALGLTIFGLLIFRVYALAPKVSAFASNAIIRFVKEDSFDYQIDLDLSIRRGDVYLHKIMISHPAEVFAQDVDESRRTVDRLINRIDYCALDFGKSEFPEKLKTLREHSLNASGVKLTQGERKRFSIVDRISVNRSADGHWNWPTEGWTLTIKTSAGNIRVPLTFSIHESSDADAFCLNYINPKATVWSC